MAAKRKIMANTWIGAAECSARTGLSTRALRIYEQQNLIKPARDSHGWRRYSGVDLTRLNTIAVLKALGLTLSQIRSQLKSGSSSLEGVLRMQMDAWLARKAAAEDAIALVRGALEHVKRHREVSIDRMCELVRCLEMNSYIPDIRGLIAKHITADDSQAWSAWWVEHPDDLAESGRYFEAQNSLFRELKAAMDAGAKPADPQVRSLMARWESILLLHHVRERAVRQMSWNYDLTLKWYTVGHKNRVAEPEIADRKVRGNDLYTVSFAAFLDAAYQNSAHGKAMNVVHEATAALIAKGKLPLSLEGRRVANSFAALCNKFSLGDPLIHAQFASFIERVNHGSEQPRKAKIWNFLEAALREHSTSASTPRDKYLPPALATSR